jgi:hypothetical protein
MTDDSEIKLDPRAVDPSTIIHGRRFSVDDYTRTALVDRVRFDGSKPFCAIVSATESMLTETEARLGFKLPVALRTLYKQMNGASVDLLWAPNKPNPGPIHGDWEDAFANDYNDIRPLEELQSLHAIYMENFDPDYDEDQRQYWFPQSEKIVILAMRIGCGTALDYRFGDEAGVIIFDLEREGDRRVRARFDSFDAFISSLRREVEPARPAFKPVDEAPDASMPNRFWCYDTYAANHGVSETAWADNAARLGVPLPSALKPFYEAINGGKTRFLMDSQRSSRADDRDGLGPFPDSWSYYAASMLPIEQWISLRELSERIDFDPRGRTPWAQCWHHADRLIVVCAAYDQALMLDYRRGDSPAVVFAGDLSKGRETIRYESVEEFLSRLRPTKRMNRELFPAIGDSQLSARVPTTETFWQRDTARAPITDALLAKTKKRLGADVPEPLAAMYAVQNGGAVRFRFHPPEVENTMRYRNAQIDATEWVDFFPGGLLPMEQWTAFNQWAKRETVAADFVTLCAPSLKYSSKITRRLFVVSELLIDDTFELALLDLSSDYFNQERSLLRARYSRRTKSFAVVIEQKMLGHISNDVLALLRAPTTELLQ